MAEAPPVVEGRVVGEDEPEHQPPQEELAPPPAVPEVPAPTGTALARPVASREVLMPLDPAQVVEGMRQYQQLLKDLLEPSDWQTEGTDKPFLKKSGIRKISRAFNLSFERVGPPTIERDEEGNPLRCEVWMRAIAPNGQYGDGDGYCSVDEWTGNRSRKKLENDLRATATTRAKNRATLDLVGMGEVSAEEINAGGNGGRTGQQVTQPWAVAASEQLQDVTKRALVYLAGGDMQAASRLWAAIVDEPLVQGIEPIGFLPQAVGQSIVKIAAATKRRADQDAAAEPPPAPKPEAPPAGTVEDTAENREQWCTCKRPPDLGAEDVDPAHFDFDDGCPIKNHGIPF